MELCRAEVQRLPAPKGEPIWPVILEGIHQADSRRRWCGWTAQLGSAEWGYSRLLLGRAQGAAHGGCCSFAVAPVDQE